MKPILATIPWKSALVALLIGLSSANASAALQSVTTNATASMSVSASGHSSLPQFSPDGGFLVYVSQAPNLVTNDDLASYLDVFVRDLETGQTRLASGNTNNLGGGNENANYPSLSPEGRFVAFASPAGNLAAGDTNQYSDIFVHDFLTGTTRRITMGPEEDPFALTVSSTQPSSVPQISADGRSVLFESRAHNLVTNCCEGTPGSYWRLATNNLYVHDLLSQQTQLISVSTNGTTGGNGHSHSAVMSADGQFVAFASKARNLHEYAPPNCGDIYARDLLASATVCASTNLPAYFSMTDFSYECSMPTLSTNGRYVAFVATGSPGFLESAVPGRTALFFHDLQTVHTICAATNISSFSWPSLSADGRWLAYESGDNVYVWDAQTGSYLLANVNHTLTGPGNAPAQGSVISPDGTRVLFLSAATDLVPEATNGVTQIYCRDLVSQTTRLVSRNLQGIASAGDHTTAMPVFSPDGQQVAFDSQADDLVANDLNQATDVFLADLETGVIELVSARHPDRPQRTSLADTRIEDQALSHDGQVIAFTSYDNGLVPGDTNVQRDVFVQNLSDGSVAGVSVNGNDAFDPDWFPQEPVLNTNGQYGAYARKKHESLRRGIYTSAYWFDVEQQEQRQVNVNADGEGTFVGHTPLISPDGRCVAFQSELPASTFVPGIQDNTSTSDIFLRDMVAGTNQLISVNLDAIQASGNATNIAFTPDGRWLLFTCPGTELVTNTTEGFPALFARDLVAGTTRLVSLEPPASGQPRYWRGAVCSGDSRWAAYTGTTPVNFWQAPAIYLYDFTTGSNRLVCTNSQSPSLSHDGRWLAYESLSGWPYSEHKNIALLNLQTEESIVITGDLLVPSYSPFAWQAASPVVSADGRFVVFQYQRQNSEPPIAENSEKWPPFIDHRTLGDIYVYDRAVNSVLLASANLAEHKPGNSRSSKLLLTANGRTVFFQSFASDLIEGDYNNQRDIFLLNLGGGDIDDDGMEDDWEWAYFETLVRDGSGDYDHDGMSDSAEFRAGTDPTNEGSVLRVLTVTSPGSASTTILWSAVAGRTYRVQFKDNVEAADWTDFPETVTAIGSTGTTTDTTADSQTKRFYRVLLIP